MKPLSVTRPVLVFGVLGGVLTVVLKAAEYRFLVLEHSFELYGALVATLFAVLGVWLGLTLVRKPETIVVKQFTAQQPGPFIPNAAGLATSALSPRELEILKLMAGGLSNKEIANRLSVSENTVKTHSRRIFGKLNARRRTQAVRAAQELGILP